MGGGSGGGQTRRAVSSGGELDTSEGGQRSWSSSKDSLRPVVTLPWGSSMMAAG